MYLCMFFFYNIFLVVLKSGWSGMVLLGPKCSDSRLRNRSKRSLSWRSTVNPFWVSHLKHILIFTIVSSSAHNLNQFPATRWLLMSCLITLLKPFNHPFSNLSLNIYLSTNPHGKNLIPLHTYTYHLQRQSPTMAVLMTQSSPIFQLTSQSWISGCARVLGWYWIALPWVVLERTLRCLSM